MTAGAEEDGGRTERVLLWEGTAQGEVPAKVLHSSNPQSATSQRSQIGGSRLALETVGRSGHGAGTIKTRLAASSPALAFIFLEVGGHVCAVPTPYSHALVELVSRSSC